MKRANKDHQENFIPIQLAPYTTCRMCDFYLTNICVEECAPARDYRHFKLKKGVDLETMPRFPLKEFIEEMSPRVRQIVVAVYLAKMADFLQGVDSGPDADRSKGRPMDGRLPLQNRLTLVEQENPASSNGEEQVENGNATSAMD